MKKTESNLDDPLAADIAFHLSILNASDNRFFMQMGLIIDTVLRSSIQFTNMLHGVPTASYKEHRRIYIPILEKQPELAEKAVAKLVPAMSGLIKKAAGIVHAWQSTTGHAPAKSLPGRLGYLLSRLKAGLNNVALPF